MNPTPPKPLTSSTSPPPFPNRFPIATAGLNERRAAVHLLSRFTFGPHEEEIERALALGLERWFDEQLAAARPEPKLDAWRPRFRALALSGAEIAQRYPRPTALLAEARRAGVIPEDAADSERDPEQAFARRELRDAVGQFAREKGYRSQRELGQELLAWKVLRATLAENQLAEVATDFWFDHFTVSTVDPETRAYVLAYERDAIHPRIFGRFRDLLGAVAHHPAMLLYLDNARSTAAAGAPTAGREMQRRVESLGRGRNRRGGLSKSGAGRGRFDAPSERGMGQRRLRGEGLNENFARELLELHTLGVDGGYSQQDVVEVARAFSGWTLLPPHAGQEIDRLIERSGRGRSAGVVLPERGEFWFRADAHDAAPKLVLGKKLAAGRGLEDGEDVLDLLAAHPNTARRIASQIAIRFVSDTPPATLVDRLAATFEATRGDLRAVLREIPRSPEFWAPERFAAKIKSPFELVISALRALDASLRDPHAVAETIEDLGQPLYAAQAPTGYPDTAAPWVNAGALLQRMNFGLALASGKVHGARVDLAELADMEGDAASANHATSREEALDRLAAKLLPERDLTKILPTLRALAGETGLEERIAKEVPRGVQTRERAMREGEDFGMEAPPSSILPHASRGEEERPSPFQRFPRGEEALPPETSPATGAVLRGKTSPAAGDVPPPPAERGGGLGWGEQPARQNLTQITAPPTQQTLAQIAGVLLGSAEFQRR